MKKLLGGFLALILMLTLLPGTALADGPVAKIESKEFDTLTEALGSAVDGETVQLIANTTVTDSLSLTKSITLDLNGKTVDWTTDASYALCASSGTLTIQDSAGGGALNITSTYAKASAYGILAMGGNLVLESGTVSYSTTTNGSACAAIATGSTSGFTMEGGTVKLLQTADGEKYAYAVFAAGNGTHSFTGGTIEMGSGVKAQCVYGVCVSMFSSGKATSIDSLTVDASQVPASSEVLCVRGGTSSPTTSVSNGVYKVNNNPDSQPAATDGRNNMQIPSLAKLGDTDFFVGESIAQMAENALPGDTIEVLIGDVALTNLLDGVTVKNSGSGTVSVNGESVAPNDSITVDSGLPFQIVAQPKDCIVTEGETATFTIVAEFTGNNEVAQIGYQWRKSTDGGETFYVIEGANDISYTTSPTTLANDGYQYDCIVFLADLMPRQARSLPSLSDTNIEGMTEKVDYLRSEVVTLSVEAANVDSGLPFQIVTQPKDSIVTEGNTATFSIVVEARDVTVGYQWRKSTDGGNTFKVIEGANDTSYTTSPTTLANDGYVYDCIVFEPRIIALSNNLPSLTDADIEAMTEETDYLRSERATLFVKEAGAEPEPEEPEVPPTGDSPLLYAAVGAAVLCLLGLCLPALRKNRG